MFTPSQLLKKYYTISQENNKFETHLQAFGFEFRFIEMYKIEGFDQTFYSAEDRQKVLDKYNDLKIKCIGYISSEVELKEMRFQNIAGGLFFAKLAKDLETYQLTKVERQVRMANGLNHVAIRLLNEFLPRIEKYNNLPIMMKSNEGKFLLGPRLLNKEIQEFASKMQVGENNRVKASITASGKVLYFEVSFETWNGESGFDRKESRFFIGDIQDYCLTKFKNFETLQQGYLSLGDQAVTYVFEVLKAIREINQLQDRIELFKKQLRNIEY